MRARKVDANHKVIAGYFVYMGWLVHHTIGDWDLTITKHGIVKLIEVKDPLSPNLKRRNKGDDLKDKGWPIHRCLTLADCVKAVL